MEQTATDKALDVLFFLRDQQQPTGITAISRALALPKSSAHRMVATLTRRGLLERDASGRYRLGLALLSLGRGFLNQDPIIAASEPVLQSIAAELGETCFLVAARAGELLVLSKAEGSGVLRVSPQVGSRVPLHSTAAGKLYLAFAPEALGAADAGSARHSGISSSPHPVGAARPDDEIDRARECGYSLNVDEWIEGLSVLAVPIFARDEMCGVIALAVPSSRFRHLDREHALGRIRTAALHLRSHIEGGSDLASQPWSTP